MGHVFIKLKHSYLLYFFPGVELVSLNASERRHKSDVMLKEAKDTSQEAEANVTKTEVKAIHVEGKYAEEHAEELEEERRNIIKSQAGMFGRKTDSGINVDFDGEDDIKDIEDVHEKSEDSEKKAEDNTDNSESRKDGFVEIFDRWGCGEDDR